MELLFAAYIGLSAALAIGFGSAMFVTAREDWNTKLRWRYPFAIA